MPSETMGVRLTEREEEEIRRLVSKGYYLSASELIRDAVRKHLSYIKILEIRDVSREQAKKEITEFLKTEKEAYASEIAEELELDVELVISIMKELEQEGIAE